MYLKKIEMQGFKSFADKTQINFEDNITAVVGPNGSGKSNVSDAIRWVLGEQSIKTLRGGKMEDIIFSGTDKRRPLGFAEVTIVFTNESRSIPIDYNEVAVTRRVFRSGESEFYINKNACRLRDIRELFMDTGIGKDGYSIIGQGKIDQILSERPEDRRHIFEEAAGIVKYRSKKEETERKLMRTDENLVRISDLLSEVKRQNNRLERESIKASKYLELFEELKLKDINLYLRDIEVYRSKLKEAKDSFNLYQESLKKMDKNIIENNKNYNIKLKELREIEIKKEAIEIEIRRLSEKINQNKQDIRILSEKETYQKKEIDRLEGEKKEDTKEIEFTKKELSKTNKKKNDMGNLLKNKNLEYINLESKLKKDLEELEKKELFLEEKKEELIDLYNKRSEIKSNIKGNNSFNQNMALRIEKLDSYIGDKEVENKALYKKFDNLKKEKKILYENKSKLKLKLDEISDLYENISNEYKKNLSDTKDIQIKLESKISNYKLYKNMENEYDGYYKSVKNLLKSIDNGQVNSHGFIGVVADLITVEKEYEKAIDVSLGSNLQNIVTETDKDAKKLIEFLRTRNMGRATFLPLNKIYGKEVNIDTKKFSKEGILGPAKNFIKYDRKYEDLFTYLLARTIIVEDLDSGLDYSKKYNIRYRLVTLEGDIINPSGAMTGGSFSKNVFSIISRKNKILDLEKEILELRRIFSNNNEKLESYKKDLINLNKEKEKLEKKLDSLDLKYLSLKNETENIMNNIDRNNLEISNYNSEREQIKSDLKELGKSDINTSQSLRELNNKIENLNNKIEKNNKIYKIEKNRVEEKNLTLTSYKIEINNIKNSKENLEYNINILEKDLISLERSVVDKEKFRSNTLIKLKEIEKEKKNKRKEIIFYKEKLEDRNEDLTKISKVYEDKKIFTDGIYKEKTNLNNKINELDKKKSELEFEISKLELYINNLNENIFGEYGIKYESAKLLEDKALDLKRIKKELPKLKRQLSELGNVNLDALEEFKEVNERYNFLKNQKNDLEKSKKQLEKVILDIETEMEEQFIITVKNINQNFSKIFKILFNGGKASINLDENQSFLDAGIEIEAQPPGKKLQNIRLLSGGEKSLTAVALLFAILELKPSPFCILDEIDAALDDANIGRYTEYLRKLNERTQFILITHRKATMEISDVLYGVTMESDGVSKLYSVKLKDFENYNM